MTAEKEAIPPSSKVLPRNVAPRARIDDQASFRRWRLAFFIFYGAIISALAGVATVAHRPGPAITAAMQNNPPTASTEVIRRTARHQG